MVDVVSLRVLYFLEDKPKLFVDHLLEHGVGVQHDAKAWQEVLSCDALGLLSDLNLIALHQEVIADFEKLQEHPWVVSDVDAQDLDYFGQIDVQLLGVLTLADAILT